MYLFFIQLFQEQYQEEMMLAITSSGIKNCISFEGQHIENSLHKEIPIIGFSFGHMSGAQARPHHVYFGSVDQVSQLEDIHEALSLSDIHHLDQVYSLYYFPVEVFTISSKD